MAFDPVVELFIKEINPKLYGYAFSLIHDEQVALDLVQDALLKWIDKQYYTKPQDQWQPLVYTILLNAVRSWGRHERIKSMVWLNPSHSEEYTDTILNNSSDGRDAPYQTLVDDGFKQALDAALKNLSMRQREAFFLRTIEGFSTEQTAKIMGVSIGSVMTHLSRAHASLQYQLIDYY